MPDHERTNDNDALGLKNAADSDDGRTLLSRVW